jgi:hypothetical protein
MPRQVDIMPSRIATMRLEPTIKQKHTYQIKGNIPKGSNQLGTAVIFVPVSDSNV